MFEFVPEDEFNDTERDVAWYLEDQERLFFWYRNIEERDYGIQGWKRYKIYPDFIFTSIDKNSNSEFERVFVVETKGLHLKASPDTEYKRSVLDICNELAREQTFAELGLAFKEKKVQFEVISEEEWQKRINEILAE